MKQNKEPFYIGLTGGIGSGKSEASKILEKLGAYIIDTDIIAREAVAPGSFGAKKIREEFGDEYFDGEELNRRKLREYAFSNKETTDKLDNIMRELIREEMCEQMLNAQGEIIVSVVPLLFEAGWQNLFNEVWLICAFNETRINRVINRDNINRDNTLKIMNSQMSDAYKKRMSDIVINNNGSIRDLEKSITKEYNRIKNIGN